MTFEEALKAEIGDVLYSVFTSSNFNENDEVILVERARDINGMEKDTGGWFYHRKKKNVTEVIFKTSGIHLLTPPDKKLRYENRNTTTKS